MKVTGSDHRSLLLGLHLELSNEFEYARAAADASYRQNGHVAEDIVDTGNRMAQRDENNAGLVSIRARQSQVERCIARMDAGLYGRCEICGESIPAERLEAYPAATTCVACKRDHER